MSIDLNDLEPFGQDVGFGYLDKSIQSPRQHNPQLVLNSPPDSMLRALRHEIRHASSFTFSVAFVSTRAIALLKQELVDFEGVGRIITSDYLGFNSPAAFAELLNLARFGIDVRLHRDKAFHPKGYVFNRPTGVTAILGSSNLTESAIARNHEWNLRVSASHESDLAAQFTNLLDFETINSDPLTQAWIDDYAATYVAPSRATRSVLESEPQVELEDTPGKILPNAMQVTALSAIANVRAAGAKRALVISATGTGKTILSALDVRAVSPERLLFVAHREQILDRAMHEFQRVLDAPADQFGKLAGTTRELDRKYVFATIQTLSRPEVLATIDPATFDYLLIDEVHRAGASSFNRVIEHLEPEFFLGMTATPERSDGANIFELFDYNVPFEIRLNSALEMDMLSPFHYYGVADVSFEDGTTVSDDVPLSRLVTSERVEHILRALETYGQAGVAPRGLMFCSRKEEARELSVELNKRTLRGLPLRTVALTGDDSIAERESVVERIEAGELDYVLTVDVFNEGVDIPTVNQVVMLRQTQSSIVFVQQLGRGLRKVAGKEYLVVIDFIGNYTNNYLIPIALFGDDSLNRESLRKNLIAAEEAGFIAGLSSIRFDRIAQERVLKSLETAKLDSWHNLKSAIDTVRQRVGRQPLLADFLRFESVDPVVLANKAGNYPALLAKLFKVDAGLTEDQSRLLTVISSELLRAKRADELLLLRELLVRRSIPIQSIGTFLGAHGGSGLNAESVVRSLTLEFNTTPERQQFKVQGLASAAEGVLRANAELVDAYQDSPQFRENVDDLLETGLALIANRYRGGDPFVPGMQYSRKDASRLLNWPSNQQGTIYGYKVDKDSNTCPIFVTLNKSDDVSASTAYHDELVDVNTMVWDTRNGLSLASKEVQAIVSKSVDIHVFAKKSDADGTGFYYLGRASADDAFETTLPADEGKAHSVVRMKLRFERPIDTALYDYFHVAHE